MTENNKQTGPAGSGSSGTLTLAGYWRALKWSARSAWVCAPRLTVSLALVNTLSSTIPALSTLAIGMLVKRLTEDAAELEDFVFWLTFTILLLLAGSWFEELQKFFQSRLSDELTLHLRQRLYRHASSLDLTFYEDRDSLDKLFRVRSGTGQGLLGPLQATINGTSGLLQVLSLFGLMVWYEPLPALVLGLAAVPIVMVQVVISRHIYRLDLETTRAKRWGNYFTQLMTDSNSIPTIRLFKLEAMLLGQLSSVLGEINERRRHLHRRKLMLVFTSSGLFFAALISVMAWLGYRWTIGTLDASELSIFGLAAFRARASVWKLVSAVGGSMDGVFVVNHFLSFLETRSSMKLADYVPAGQFSGNLELQSVSFRYPRTEMDVVKDVSLHFPAGQTVAIVGQNGAGKSTLMKLICRLYDPVEGQILLDGVDLRKLSPAWVNGHLSLVQQWPVRFEATVRDIIAYGDWQRFQSDPGALEAYLERLPIKSFIDRLPEGQDTMVGRKFGEITLSDGQWQQLSIARAMARDSSILILDEPMANLDAIAERELFDWVCQLGREQTIILVSHRFSTVQMADRIVVLEEGRVAEDGTHQELLTRDGLYANMFNSYYGL